MFRVALLTGQDPCGSEKPVLCHDKNRLSVVGVPLCHRCEEILKFDKEQRGDNVIPTSMCSPDMVGEIDGMTLLLESWARRA